MKVLIVDDETEQAGLLADFLKTEGHDVLTASNGLEAIKLFKKRPIELVLLDHKMPGMTGDEVLEELKRINPLVKAIMITAYGSVQTAVKVMKLGAVDFLEKPIDLDELLEKIQKLEHQIETSQDIEDISRKLDVKPDIPLDFIAKSHPMQELIAMAARVAASPWTVLLSGETGTGKGVLAKLVHKLSPRCNMPFVEVNCAAIPENLFESELFGHKKGAFTGAVTDRKGRFELANKGTLFLDEVGELPLTLQTKLLKTLQEGKITPVGSEKEIQVDVRVVAATNRNLKQMVKERSFREDLYYRLNVFELLIPPLRERKEDITALIDYFVKKYALKPTRFSQEALDVLIKHDFPGNVRELEHLVQRLVTLCRTGTIKLQDIPHEIKKRLEQTSGAALNEKIELIERQTIVDALFRHGWNQSKAAQSLGISERVIRYKMARLNIKRGEA